MDYSHGHSRESITDAEELVLDIMHSHPNCREENGKTVIPTRYLRDIFLSLVDRGLLRWNANDDANLQAVLVRLEENEPDPTVDDTILFQFVLGLASSHLVEDDNQIRGRSRASSTSSDSSSGSNGTSRNPSRPSSRSGHPPPTPTQPKTPLDKRQRSTPLSSNPPSSYQRQPPPARRRSSASPGRGYSSGSAGGDSDSGPGRKPRSRAGSQSVTSPPPSSTAFPLSPRVVSPTRDRFLAEGGSSSPEDSTTRLPRMDYDFVDSISKIPVSQVDSDSSDDENDGRGSPTSIFTHLEYNPEYGTRSTTSSTASLLPGERLEALARANADLGKRLQEAEDSYSRKMSEHEIEMEQLEQNLEELRSELARSKREEKELRAKERNNINQISSLEAEVARITKDLATTKDSYHTLQKQYAEQTQISERYRGDLRNREDTIRSLQEQSGLQDLELGKMAEREREWEDRVIKLERELTEAQEGCTELEKQKLENLALKETIDRLRFEMDEMRNAMTSGLGTFGMPGSGASSRANTISKSLGAELQSQLEKEERAKAERGDTEDDDTEGEDTVVEEVVDDNDEEGNFITTIIKRTRRKVSSKAQTELPTPKREHSGNKYTQRRIEEFEDEKEYADCAIQYDTRAFFDPDSDDGFLRSTSLQTDFEPVPAKKEMVGIDIQTEEPEEDESAASSSTVTPAVPMDEPPAYPGPSTSSQEKEREREEQAELAVLRKWHHSQQGRGLLDIQQILADSPQGDLSVPKSIIEDWARIRRVAGVDCDVVDRLLIAAAAAAEGVVDGETEQEAKKEPSEPRLSFRRLSSHLPNLPGNMKLSSYIPPTILYGSLSVLVGVVLAPHLANQMVDYGGATYYDRRAWASFNALGAGGEGFPGFGGGHQGGAEGALWQVLEAILGGGARYARGFPT